MLKQPLKMMLILAGAAVDRSVSMKRDLITTVAGWAFALLSFGACSESVPIQSGGHIQIIVAETPAAKPTSDGLLELSEKAFQVASQVLELPDSRVTGVAVTSDLTIINVTGQSNPEEQIRAKSRISMALVEILQGRVQSLEFVFRFCEKDDLARML
jgi:hypothetical protein